MKVVILGAAYPYRGGLAAHTERLARQFLADGDEVEICNFSMQYPSLLFPGKTQYSDGSAPAGLRIVRRVNSCNPFNWLRVGRRLRRDHPDVLVVAYGIPYMAPCMGTIARIVRRDKHIKVIGLIHNILPHEQHRTDRMLSGYFTRSVDGFLVMVDAVRDELATFRGATDKPTVVSPHPLYDHYGTRLPRAEACRLLHLDTSPRYLLSFGFIRHYKGLDLLLDAMADPAVVAQGVHLIVAGEFYGDATAYHEQIQRLQLTDRVHLFTDYIPDDEVNRYFSAADLVVLPYRSATQSGVTQIGYHFERPMLVTHVGGLPEIVPDGVAGLVVDPTPQSIADGITRYFRDNLEPSLTQGLLHEKQRYSWSRMTAALRRLMEQIVK